MQLSGLFFAPPESKAGERMPTGWMNLPFKSHASKMSSRCLRRDSSNDPPSSGIVPRA